MNILHNFAIKHDDNQETLVLIVPQNTASQIWISDGFAKQYLNYNDELAFVSGYNDYSYVKKGTFTQPDVEEILRLYAECCTEFKLRIHDFINEIEISNFKDDIKLNLLMLI